VNWTEIRHVSSLLLTASLCASLSTKESRANQHE
jgi:hypothetical protein